MHESGALEGVLESVVRRQLVVAGQPAVPANRRGRATRRATCYNASTWVIESRLLLLLTVSCKAQGHCHVTHVAFPVLQSQSDLSYHIAYEGGIFSVIAETGPWMDARNVREGLDLKRACLRPARGAGTVEPLLKDDIFRTVVYRRRQEVGDKVVALKRRHGSWLPSCQP